MSAGGGDRDVSWVFLFLTNLLRKYDPICGYVYTELSDIEWEHNGFMNYDRSPKEFPYPAGITLADLQGDEFVVLDCPPYRKVAACSEMEVPILFSHWSEREDLILRLYADGKTIDGTAWSDSIRAEERAVTPKPYAVTPLGPFKIALPDAAGLLNVVAEVVHDGERVAANYCVLDVRGGAAWTEPDVYAAPFPVGAFSALGFERPDVDSFQRPGKVFGYGTGYVEYELRFPMFFRGGDVTGARLRVELGAKADKERLDWPARVKPQDYPQTDGNAWPTDVVFSINGVPFHKATIADDFADARGVLSHVAHYHHGSRGELLDVPIEGEALDALLQAVANHTKVTLRLEVPTDAQHPGGLAIYGKELGAYPADPTLVFSLKPGARKPKHTVRTVNAASARVKVLVKRAPEGHVWRYTTEGPGEDWTGAAYDDTEWAKGKGGFGASGMQGASVGTPWKTSDIWLRTSVRVPRRSGLDRLCLDLYHDEDVEVYVNGTPLIERKRYRSDYERIVLTGGKFNLFKKGKSNLIAVHCHQTGGGQYIDLGLTGVK